ncbi:unnamed protein product [Linum tenue]|uniref:Uncharacterized protein n=1 Tax=Linum tenue TaxID=586396 RepID=A0AAV0IID8_9ROSI|nr:unnamed protein product [Linum tenue]
MGRSPCCEKAHTNKGAWTKEEDQRLIDYIRTHGEGCWRSLPKSAVLASCLNFFSPSGFRFSAGLLRCGKSCRLRWINYLRPDLKRGNFSEEEDELIIKLHSLLGNKWSLIAGRLPGRTDNEIKNYWNTHIKRKLMSRGIDPQTHRSLNEKPTSAVVPVAPATTTTVTAAAVTVTPPAKPTQLDFKSALAPAQSMAEINRLLQSNTMKANNSILDFKFQTVVKAESVEENNCSTSGMTTDEEPPLPRPVSADAGGERREELNLELTIGLATPSSRSLTTTRPSSASSGNSAESKLQFHPYLQFSGTAATPTTTAAEAVCLCWQLGGGARGNCHCQCSSGGRQQQQIRYQYC